MGDDGTPPTPRPGLMKKAKAELDYVVGPTRKLEESDIDNLPYLNAVVK